jgi:steroid delta-isomerase-like uncharacterized protein
MKNSILVIAIMFMSMSLMAQKNNVEKDLKMYSMVWDNVINKGNMDYFTDQYFDTNVTLVAAPENIVGIPALKSYWESFLAGFSDVEFTILNSFGQGDDMVKHWHFKGKHTGNFFGIPPSGNTVDMDGTTIIKMKNGKIAREQDFFDSSVFMQQLGVGSNPNNAKIIGSLYEMFSKGDVPAVLELMDEKIVWNEAEGNALAAGNPYIGPDAVLKGVFVPISEKYNSFTLKDVKLHDMSDNQVLATLYYVMETKNGKSYTVEAAHHWTLQNGKIVQFQQYADTRKLAESDKM